jgi:hypothetical protein
VNYVVGPSVNMTLNIEPNREIKKINKKIVCSAKTFKNRIYVVI